jgi:protein-L-isoaspartate(D-aspartate) O-methyltransferase
MAWDGARATMLERDLRGRGISDPRVLAALESVPREMFVPPAHADAAYADTPLGIGCGQTISQPYVVALTVEALGLVGDERVLEIGTGSGYAAAVLAKLAWHIETVERIAELADRAERVLAKLGITNVHVRRGDGSLGWVAGAPYDAIAVAAAAPLAPPSLLAQLAIGGRLVLPIGESDQQRLVRITRTEVGYTHADLGEVRFVPLIGAEGWASDPRRD